MERVLLSSLLLLWVGCAESARLAPDAVHDAGDRAIDLSDPKADLAGPPAAGADLASTVNPNDQDGDGVLGGLDCDDHDPVVYPGAPEVCNGKDDDCDGLVDVNALDAITFYPDVDMDGLGNSQTPVRSCVQPAGWVPTAGDCDDRDPAVGAPLGTEFCIADVGPQAIFVSHLHGNDGNTGASPVQAVQTIGVGITRALKCAGKPCAVVIAVGEYREVVALADGVSLFGGYSDDFMSRDVVANLTRISSDQPVTVSADNLAVATKLDGLAILGADFSSRNDGASSVALRVRNSSGKLTLQAVDVAGGRGAGGAHGDNASVTSCSTRGGQGGSAFDCGASTGADGDADSDAKSGGGGGSGGNSNCPDACPLVGGDGITGGSSGHPGADGAPGDPGVAATDRFGAFGAGAWSGALGSHGARGRHGTGGGGGGSGGTKRFRACFGCGSLLGGRGGDGGPGGCGGGGGNAAGAGGGVFAVVLVDAAITVKDSHLGGGVGGQGGTGGAGADGQAGSTSVGVGHADGGSQKCGLIWYYSGGGGVGGVGGRGGAGGGGAGGVGGVAVTVARVGASQLTKSGTVVVDNGMGGQGGNGGASSGNGGAPGLDGEAAAERAF